MIIITLSNGKRVGNFSSPHPFTFEDGSILPAVSNEEAERLKVNFIEYSCYSFMDIGVYQGIPGDVRLSFTLTASIWIEIEKWWNAWKKKEVDVVFCPLPMITALKDDGRCWLWQDYVNSPFRAVRMEDRIKKLVSIHKQCI